MRMLGEKDGRVSGVKASSPPQFLGSATRMITNVHMLDPYARAFRITSCCVCKCGLSPRVRFSRGTLRCMHCKREIALCDATKQTLVEVSFKLLKFLAPDASSCIVGAMLDRMPFEDMIHLLFACANRMYGMPYAVRRKFVYDNMDDSEVFYDVLDALYEDDTHNIKQVEKKQRHS